MKKIIFLLILISGSFLLNAENLKLYWIHNNTEKLIYTSDKSDSYQKKILERIRKGERISVFKAEKACVREGEYRLEVDGTVYCFQNEYWIYDEKSGSFLRCNLLDISRELLIDYLIDETEKS